MSTCPVAKARRINCLLYYLQTVVSLETRHVRGNYKWSEHPRTVYLRILQPVCLAIRARAVQSRAGVDTYETMQARQSIAVTILDSYHCNQFFFISNSLDNFTITVSSVSKNNIVEVIFTFRYYTCSQIFQISYFSQ